MVKVTLTANLQKYFPRRTFECEPNDVYGVLRSMDSERPNFSNYILEDDQRIRRHVNVFVNGEMIRKDEVRRRLKSGDTVHIMQALSGG